MKNESASKLFETLLDGTEARIVKEQMFRCNYSFQYSMPPKYTYVI